MLHLGMLVEPDPPESILRYLIELPGAFSQHSGLSLFHHLLGTFRILKRWNADEDVCRAGLFHSVYGTPAFPDGLLVFNQRDELAEVIGGPAEILVFEFSKLRWGVLLSQGVTTVAGIDPRLVLVAAANLLEQSGRLMAAASFDAGNIEVYGRLLPHLPPAAAACVAEALQLSGERYERPV